MNTTEDQDGCQHRRRRQRRKPDDGTNMSEVAPDDLYKDDFLSSWTSSSIDCTECVDSILSKSSPALEKAELIAHNAWEALPFRTYHTVEDIAQYVLMCVPEISLEKANEIARHALETLPFRRAEEIAHHAWETVPGHALDKLEEIARHVWESVPELPLERAEEAARKAWETMKGKAFDKAEAIAQHAWEIGWNLMHHHHLPNWLKDNDFLVKGHRPPLNSYWACFKSIFSIHTETGNIWTHLLGCVAFICVAIYFLLSPSDDLKWQDKVIFTTFFAGAILCLGFSWTFHTLYCHSEKVGRIFSKLDYCGISLLIMGSSVPWLYYSFYCRLSAKLVYLVIVCTLGITCIFVSMWDFFAEPRFRVLRAGVFAALGLTGIVPTIHFVITDGVIRAINLGALGWLALVGILYLFGAVMYAARFPECIWPGKFDIWFQSHQIFHVCVVAAAFVHYHGMSKVANNRLELGNCMNTIS